MRLRELLEHIKHKSLSIRIVDSRGFRILYDGDVGGYSTSVIKSKLNDRKVVVVIPDDNLLQINLGD